MSNTTILILEDDMIIAADISMHLTRMGYEVTGILARGEDAIKTVRENPPDIILVDIQLKGKLDGIQTAEHLMTFSNTIIIFLTANADEATFERAKLTKPHAFISKPFKRLDLTRAIELALIKMEENHQKKVVQNDQRPEEATESYILEDRIFVKSRDRMIKIYTHDILYAEADRNYCKVHTSSREHLMTLPLKAFESKLSSPDFLRIHRSYIVNLTKVDALMDHCEYVTIGQKHIPVSRTYKEVLIKRLKLI